MKKIVLRMLEPATAVLFFLIVAYCGVAGYVASMATGYTAAFTAVGALMGIVFATVITGVVYLLISCHRNLDGLDRAGRPAA